MNRILTILVALVCLTGCSMSNSQQGAKMEPQLAHIVFFTLNDPAPAKVEQLVRDCHTYLKDHPGVLYFSAGKRVEELVRPVNDQNYQVAIHVIFENKAAHDQYQTAAQHLKFIELNKANWKTVRVFDSFVE